MKILKIRVISDEDGKMLYPDGFVNFPCIEHIYCDDLETDTCWLVVLIQDKNFDEITDKTNVEEIDVSTAEKFLEKYEPLTTEVTDEGLIKSIEIKSRIGIELSDKELAAIDPTSNIPGIQYRKRFIDKVKTRLGI